jgi:hypothetical protein
LVIPPAFSASTRPCDRLAISQPSEARSSDMVWMSASLGALVRVSGWPVSRAAGISVRQAFFAPEISMVPFSGLPPVTAILSMRSARPCLSRL